MTQTKPSESKPMLLTPLRLGRIFFVLAACGVGLGAFGAHALKDIRAPNQLEIWKTATLYLLVHTIAGGCLSLIAEHRQVPRSALLLFFSGSIVFAGSLYALVLTQISLLGAVTPLGGLMFISGWLTLAVRLR